MTEQKLDVFRPTEEGVPTRFSLFAARVDYLESYCRGINAYRGEDADHE